MCIDVVVVDAVVTVYRRLIQTNVLRHLCCNNNSLSLRCSKNILSITLYVTLTVYNKLLHVIDCNAYSE